MDLEFEAGLLRIIDRFLAAPPTEDAFRRFDAPFMRHWSEGERRATAHLRERMVGRRAGDPLPEGYKESMDELMPADRRAFFGEIMDQLNEVALGDLTEADRIDGLRSVDEFVGLLRQARERYREQYGC